jgi:hypothetical protein
MSRTAKSQDLLYVSDAGTNAVYVYDFPGLKLSGTLKGFHQPQGQCADAKGNVWIADTESQEIVQYAHGGTKQTKALRDPSGYPLGCAIDAASGDLAVTNIFDVTGSGAVLVYKSGSGKPAIHTNSEQYYYYFDGYDTGGNLYVSGRSPSGAYMLSELPKGSHSMSTVSLSGGTIYFPGTVQWVGKTIVLGDQACGNASASCFYEASASGSGLQITGTTPFTGACDIVQGQVVGKVVAGGDFEYCSNGKSTIDLWPYAAGGSPTKQVAGVSVPIGAALSK